MNSVTCSSAFLVRSRCPGRSEGCGRGLPFRRPERSEGPCGASNNEDPTGESPTPPNAEPPTARSFASLRTTVWRHKRLPAMKRYIARRLMQGVVLLCLVAAIVFFLGRLTGNPVDLMLPEDATPEDRAALIRTLGLDGSILDQFLIFVGNAVQGDLGMSIRMKQPAVEAFFDRLPNTLVIIPWALLLAMALGIPLGVVAALHRGGLLDRAAGAVAVLGVAMPSFWLGVLLIFVFSVELGWLPSGRMGGPAHYVLPVVTLGMFLVAGFMRITRSAMLEVMESEFVKLARIKGLSEGVVIWKHCLRNALIPVLTLWGVFVGNLITGAIVTETVFAWPGIGRLTYEAVIYRDFPLLQAVIILKSILILVINLGVDILYAYVDPRIRLA
ncbi:ABC transporter permease subunit [Reyranella sp. CPCC 100927]|nr:ABC transporter permease subunit [Reyranella sp. CPCC 100927]